MPQLRYTTFDGTVHTHELKPGTTRIGRTPDNDLQIDELAVSGCHCELRCRDGTILVKDLDSMGGTYVDGVPIIEQQIRAGQSLSLGTFLVLILDSANGPAVGSFSRTDLRSVPLADGSYSCLRHPSTRAIFQCNECFDLACDECVDHSQNKVGLKEAVCRSCNAKCERIDWSGLTMGKKEALVSLLPPPAQKALDFWQRRRAKPKS